MPKKENFEKNLPNWDPNRLKVVRSIQHMTQEDFAKRCGTSLANISNVERGIIYPSAVIIAVVAKMGYDINWFLNGVNQDNPEMNAAIDDFGLLAEIKALKPEQTKFFNSLARAFLQVIEEK